MIFVLFNWLFYRVYMSNVEQVVINESKNSIIKNREFIDMILENMDYTIDVLQSNNLIQKQIDLDVNEYKSNYRMDLDIVSSIQNILMNSSYNSSAIDLYLYENGKLYTSDYGVYQLEKSYKDYL